MHPDFQVESRSYDQQFRGSWRGYRLDTAIQLSDEKTTELASDCMRLWLPAGTLMHWATRPFSPSSLRNNCLQLYWPERWYTLSAFYNDRSLIHTYATIIQPAAIQADRLAYVDLDLSLLVEPDFSYEVLTQAEFDQSAETLGYSEETRIGALLALQMLTNAARLATGLFAAIPHTLRQTDFHLAGCRS
jgi:protein associated with RNAse G/E